MSGILLALGLPVLACGPAIARDHEGQVKLDVDNQMLADTQWCIKTDTSMTYPRGSDRSCSPVLHVRQTATLWVDGKPGDHLYLDFEIFGEHTHNDKDITGATQCTVTGSLFSAPLRCNTPTGVPVAFSESPMSPFAINVNDPNDPGMALLNLLAWTVSAAAVAGLLVVGMNMALQFRRGDPGEFSEHSRGLLIVGGACVLGATAGPIVQFLSIY